MDPTANLNRQRRLAKEIFALSEAEPTAANVARLTDAGYELAELVEALDEWMTSGGFAPEAWRAQKPR